MSQTFREANRRIDAIVRPWRAVGAMIAAVCGAVLGMIVVSADPAALVWTVLLTVIILASAAALIEPAHRRPVLLLAALAMGLHVSLALVLHELALGFGSGFITGDDAAYFRLSSALASYWGGHTPIAGYTPPLWGGDAYLLGAFVYVEAALFTVFGPDVRIALILNAGLATVTALLAYASATRLFGQRAAFIAFIAVAFFPSLLLWSALNLKDSLTIALAMLAIWVAIEYRARPRPFLALVPFAPAEILVTLRSYTAATVAIACLVAIALVNVPVTRRVATIAVAGLLTTVIVGQGLHAVGSGIGEQLLLAFERERAAMAVGARTGFVATATPVAASPSTGDGRPSVTATPTQTASAAPTDDIAPATGRTLAYLPIGFAYALLAPIPFASLRLQELLTGPEMVIWYVFVIAGVATIWRERRRWRSLAPVVLIIVGLITVLALAEGNVGTLFRHRGMVVPFAAVLASPSLLAASRWLRRPQHKDTTG